MVHLIHIPEIPSRLPINQIKDFIKTELGKRNIRLPSSFRRIKVNLEKVYSTTKLDDRLKEMQQIAAERGGKCLSEEYSNDSTKLLWECSVGHQWYAVSSSIKMGTWCPKCGGSSKRTIRQMQSIAIDRGGKCLSDEYVNSHTKLLWECSEGHQWEAIPTNIISGKWCPICAGIVKLTIEDMQQIAEERHGKCLSTKYVNARTRLLWECSEGHQWYAVPDSIKRGSWCPECARKAKKKIDSAHIN